MWQPKLTKFPHKEPTKGILFKAFQKVSNWGYVEALKDDYGTFAIVLNPFILVAKKYIYGWNVSAHSRAVWAAFNQKKPLVMYIDSADKFYKFEPKDIIETGKKNYKGKAEMINFSVKIGERADV